MASIILFYFPSEKIVFAHIRARGLRSISRVATPSNFVQKHGKECENKASWDIKASGWI